jgi:hypothetical protein
MPIVLDASQVVIKQLTNRGSTGERKGRGGGRRGIRTGMTEPGIVIDVGTTDVGIGMGGDHDGKQHWGGGEVTGGCGTRRRGGDGGSRALLPMSLGRRGGDRGIRSHCYRGEGNHTGRCHASAKSNREEEERRAAGSDGTGKNR